MKCDTCLVKATAFAAEEPSVCIWFMEEVVCGNKTPEECDEYIPFGESEEIKEVGLYEWNDIPNR